MLGCQGPNPTVHAQAPPSASASRCGESPGTPTAETVPARIETLMIGLRPRNASANTIRARPAARTPGGGDTARGSAWTGARGTITASRAEEAGGREGGGLVGEQRKLRHA